MSEHIEDNPMSSSYLCFKIYSKESLLSCMYACIELQEYIKMWKMHFEMWKTLATLLSNTLNYVHIIFFYDS
jgi:hypothetical protein